MRKQVLLLLFVLVPLLAICQKNKRFRWEIGFGLGASNFLGDLGGANRIGTHFVRDLEISLTRPAVAMHMRYRANRFIGFRANLAYGIVNGNDALTEEKYRKNRNLNFKSNIIELSTVVEFYISKERPGHLYNYKRVKGWRSVDIQTYGFVGIGGFYFNPKGFGFGQWYELRPLGTEGQLVGDPKTYSNYSLCAPIGLGFKYGLNRQWSIGFDFGLRLTMTDYIDDVSTNYYDPALIAAAQPTPSRAALAVHFADPNLQQIPVVDGIGVTDPGNQRGNPAYNDAYMFTHVTLNYKIGRFKKTHSKF